MPLLHGHFPGNPLVPGALQIEWLMELLPADAGLPVVENAKFLKPLRPPVEAELALLPTSNGWSGTVSSSEGLHCVVRFVGGVDGLATVDGAGRQVSEAVSR